MSKRIMWRIVVAALLWGAPGLAVAQGDYPSRTIKIIVPLVPGGAADVVPRIIAEKLTVRFGHPVVIENRPGANGNTIFRKDDGTYWNYNPNTGATSAAGTWNNRAGTSALGSGSGGGGNSFGAPPPSYTPYTPPPQQGAEYNTQIANVNGYNASGEYVGGMDGTIPPGELLAGSTP